MLQFKSHNLKIHFWRRYAMAFPMQAVGEIDLSTNFKSFSKEMISICYHWLKTRLILWTLYKQHLLLPEIPTRAASCCCCCWQCCTENDLDKITGTAAEIIWISIIQKCHARIQGTWPRLLKSQIQILKYVKRTTVNVFESINEPRTTTIIHTVKSVRVGGWWWFDDELRVERSRLVMCSFWRIFVGLSTE